ncbi:MAG: DUF4406 domain-containing protein [Streptococcaceae bacterium]|jgi:hypothetical protein|nr:DUF4406 domain-containing protein [Streptococcaceae bacterium]
MTKKQEHNYRPLVYICSPYSLDVERNTKRAREFCRFALEEDAIPFAPHLLFPQFMDDDNPEERELAMRFNKIMQGKCDEMWVLGNYISEGMRREISIAQKRRQYIRWFDINFQEVAK